MLKSTFVAPDATVSNATLTKTLLDGASFYGFAQFDKGRFGYGFYGMSSEGLITPYGQGAPAWGAWEMFTDGTVGVDYNEQWDLTGASAPTTYEILTGDLPDGLALASPSGNQGTISGTPTIAGTFNFTLRATNEFGTADKAFSITIVAPAGGGAWTFLA